MSRVKYGGIVWTHMQNARRSSISSHRFSIMVTNEWIHEWQRVFREREKTHRVRVSNFVWRRFIKMTWDDDDTMRTIAKRRKYISNWNSRLSKTAHVPHTMLKLKQNCDGKDNQLVTEIGHNLFQCKQKRKIQVSVRLLAAAAAVATVH